MTAVLATGGTVNPDAITTFSVELIAGETYLFSAYGSGGQPLTDTYLYVFDDTGAPAGELAHDDDGGAGTNSLLSFTASYTGTYQIGVGAYPDSGLSGDFTLDGILRPGVDAVGQEFDTAPALALGTVTYGFIDPGIDGFYGPGYSEVDTYAITLEAGKIYRIEVAGGADYGSDSQALPDGELDTVIQLYDANGNSVRTGDDIDGARDVSSRINFLPSVSGTYYLDVYSYAPGTGGYSIIAEDVSPAADLGPVASIYAPLDDNIPVDKNDTAYVYFALPGENFGVLSENGIDPMPSLGWNAFEKQQTMLALAEYSRITGITYEVTESVDQATFRLIATDENLPYAASFNPFNPSYGAQQGIGVFKRDDINTHGQQEAFDVGGYWFAILLHEFGHAHGLAHPFGGGLEVMHGVTDSDSYGDFDLNQGVNTVMSYIDAWKLHPDGPSPYTYETLGYGWSATLGALDIAALQQRYGIHEYATGDDVYLLKGVNASGTYYSTIWDTGGTDTIQFDGAANAKIDLGAATLDYSPTGGGVVSFVSGIWGGFTIANGVVIENATGGSGDDALTGNSAPNALNGRTGLDTMSGGLGDDTYFVDNAGDVVLEGAGAGTDTVRSSISYQLGGNVENLLLTGATAINGTGNTLANTITGNSASNTLSGGAGADTMRGSLGDDTYFVDNAGDVVLEGAGAGTDTVRSSVSHLLSSNVENLLLTGAAATNGTGNTLANTITGNTAGNTLSGGTGADTMRGGLGDDTYIVDNAGDVCSEGAGAGTDTVRSSVSCQLGSNVENLLLTGAAALNGTGNTLANSITGNTAGNTLSGGTGADILHGQAGADVLIGALGSDFLYGGVDNAVDRFDFNSIAETVVGPDRDRVYNFVSGTDKVDLRTIDADIGLAGNQVFAISDTGPAAHSVWIVDSSANLIVRGDVDGNTTTDFEMVLLGINAMSHADFML